MNRKLYVGIMSFFAVVFTISITLLPYYNPIYFYLQHISLFLFMAMFIYYLLKLGFDRLQKRVRNTSVLKGYTITVLVVLLFLFSNLQLYAIETYQTSEFQYCFYYDEYYNPIYYSQLVNSCPDLEILEQTDTSLSFYVYENNEGNDDYDYIEGIDLENIDFKSKIRTDIDLEYDLEGNIINSSIHKSANILLSDGLEEYKIYNSVYYQVENVVIYDGDEPIDVESYQTKGVLEDSIFDFQDFEQVHHYLDNQYRFEYIKYTSNKTEHEMNEKTKDDMYQVLIREQLFDISTFEGLPVEDKVIQQLDFVCDDVECNVKREDFNLRIDNYLELVENDMAESDLDYTYKIRENRVEVKYPYYHYQENKKSFTTVSYSKFKDYSALMFESNTKSYTNMLNRPIERSSFKYRGNDYLEHGDQYSVIYNTNYGYKVINKSSEMEAEQDLGVPIIYASSIFFIPESFYRVEDMYDYGLRATYNLSDRDEIVYFYNPLIFRLLDTNN